uniref:Small ribosomal subunit protein uS7m n=1 Tax=Angiostrongylus cantonensis TaxID=6313 RepID=A0A0K0D1A4_ANGCA
MRTIYVQEMSPQWSLCLTLVRSISNTRSARTRYDPHLFREPVTDIKQAHEPLDENDERNFLFLKAMKSDETPVFYRDHIVDKLIRVFMKSGGKETTKKHVYAALEIIKSRQYKAWRQADDGEKCNIELDPFVIARRAIENCHPLMKLQGVTRGGTTYQVPFPIEKAEAEFRAMKMMRDICRQKAAHGETHLKDILASELLLASQNEGLTIQAKQELHKTCEANRAYAHYRS